MAGSLRMYAISKTPNSEVLDDTTTGGPPLPTIHELDPLVPSKAEWLWRGRRGLLFFPNGEFIAKVKLHHHLQPLLSDPASTASDVYLVARPESLTIPFGSLLHWSFYTQGFFYHLSALDRSRDDTWSSQNPTKSTNTVCRLKYEDLSTVNSEDYIRFQGPLGRKVFLAYKVGQTDYRPDQILKLAEWVVRQLSAYGLFSANCQHFATTMVRRTVMRVGDRSAFAGTATQIVDWDLRKESQLHVNGIERGFLVAPPLPSMKYSPIALKIDILSANRSLYIVDESMLDSFLSKCSWLFKVRGYIQPIRIRIFYEKGSGAIGAWHPSGYYSKCIREAGVFFGKQPILLYHAWAEFKEDLSQKRWKDAFYGRYKMLPDGTMKRPLLVRSKYF